VATGLILLVFLALLCTYLVHRVRRRMGLPVSSRLWVTIVVGFVLIVLTAWVASGGRH
jgi:predicted PurR-regulated permease PerM